MEEPEKLLKFQEANWDPVLKWFKQRYVLLANNKLLSEFYYVISVLCVLK